MADFGCETESLHSLDGAHPLDGGFGTGNPAVSPGPLLAARDRRLCVPTLRWVCPDRGVVNLSLMGSAKRLRVQTTFYAVVTLRSFADELKLNFDVEICELARGAGAQSEHSVLDRRDFDEQRDLRALMLQAGEKLTMAVQLRELRARETSPAEKQPPPPPGRATARTNRNAGARHRARRPWRSGAAHPRASYARARDADFRSAGPGRDSDGAHGATSNSSACYPTT